jgi:hypothetical protein
MQVGQSKYKKIEHICKRLVMRPAYVEWHELAAAAREGRSEKEEGGGAAALARAAHAARKLGEDGGGPEDLPGF